MARINALTRSTWRSRTCMSTRGSATARGGGLLAMTDIDRLPLSSWGAPDIADEIADKDVIVVKGGSVYTRLERQPAALVQAEVAAEARKLLAGVSKDTFSIGSRAKVELRDVELIVKDLVRKQELLRRLGWARSGEVISASAAD